MKIYFYPHAYLRDRQLETIRQWPSNQVFNKDIADNRQGAQVSRSDSLAKTQSWFDTIKLPLLNIKLRPKGAPTGSIVYVWGGLVLSGEFIVDLDNPWSLVGYNVNAMPIYRFFIKKILLSQRCLEIRCMSKACKASLKTLFGDIVSQKARLHYPTAGIEPANHPSPSNSKLVRFLFIGTQFEIKGGEALLQAFEKASKKNTNIQLDLISHLPENFFKRISKSPKIILHDPNYTREQIFSEFLSNCDVLIHTSYMESFGMTVFEAISQGLAVIANDIYALRELVIDGKNGFLLDPPITKWDGVLPNDYFMKKNEFLTAIRGLSNEQYVDRLADCIVTLSEDTAVLDKMKKSSLSVFKALYE